MLGYREAEVANNFTDLQDMIHPDDLGIALEAWLEVVQRDHGSARDAAKDAMVSVFQVLGRQDELVVEHQRRLYQALH